MCLVKKGVHSNMNKIFKVVWSKTKECYVVVSEVAKNNGGKKKALASVLAGLAMVAATAGTPVQADVGLGGSAVNISPNGTYNGSNTAGKNSVVVGYQNKTDNEDGTLAYGANNTAYGNSAFAIGNNNVAKGGNAYAMGNTAEALGTATLAFGNQAKAKADYGVAIGSGAEATANNAVAVGRVNKATNASAVALGVNNKANGQDSTAVGSTNTVNGDQSSAFGRENVIDGASVAGATAVGYKNKASGDRAIAIGEGNDSKVEDTITMGHSNTASVGGGIAIGQDNVANSGGNAGNTMIAIGRENEATALDTVAIGRKTKATANTSVALGARSEATGAGSVAIGGNGDGYKTTSNGLGAVALGMQAKADGTAATAVGGVSEATANGAAAFGQGAKATAASATALGKEAKASVADGVALGSQSKATVDKGVKGFNPAETRTNKYSGLAGTAQTSTLAAVSVGDGATATRQITGLAAGTNDTDAVNVAQLRSVNLKYAGNTGNGDVLLDNGTLTVKGEGLISTEADANAIKLKLKEGDTITDTNGKAVPPTTNGVATTDNVAQAINRSGWNVTSANNGGTTNGTTSEKVSPGDTVTFKAGKNIVLDQAGKQFTYSLNKDVDLTKDGSLTIGDTKVNNDGLTITGGPSVTKTGIDAGNKNITNVKAGVNDTDAVNVKQLKDAKTKLVDGKNTTVEGDGSTATPYKVNVEGDLKGITSISNADGGPKMTIGGNSINITGGPLNMGGSKITNVAPGTDDTDAVNYSQIKGLRTEVKAGTNVTVDKTQGTDGHDIYTVNATATGGAASSWNIKSSATDGKNNGITTATNISDAKTVEMQAGKNLTVKQADTANGASVEFALDKDVDLTNDGSLTIGDTVINKDGMTITGGPSVTKTGIDAGNKNITNVKAGENDTDAVNVKQLKDAKTKLVDGKNTTVEGDGSTATPYKVNVEGDLKGITSISNADGGPKMTIGGNSINITGGPLNMGGSKITNVAPGTDDTDAVNVKQLKAAKTEVKAGAGVTVAKSQGAEGQDIYTVSSTGATGNTDPSKVEGGKNTTVTGDGTAATPYKVNVEGDLTDISSITNGNGSGKIAFAGDQVVKVEGDNPISLDGKGGYVTGLQNKDWDITNPTFVSGRAATEDQLKKVSDGFNNTVKLAGNTGNTDTQKLSQTGGLSFGVVGANNGQYIKTTAAGTDVVADLSDDAKAKLNHKVEVQGVGTNVHVTEDTTQAGKTIYKVAVDAASATGASSTESVVKKSAAAGDTNIADITVGNGKNSGAPDAQYEVSVSKNAVKDAAREAVTVNNGGTTTGGNYTADADNPITVNPVKDDANHNTTYEVKFDGDKAAKQIPLTYKANGTGDQKVKLDKGLDFTNGSNTTASVAADGVVKYDLNKDVDLTNGGSLTIGDTVMNNGGLTITGGPSVTKTGIDAGNKNITNVKAGENDTDAVNVKQLKDARTVVTSKDNSVTINKTENGNQVTYDLHVNAAAGTASTWNLKSGAVSATEGTHSGDTDQNIADGKSVTMQAGKNLTVKQTNDGNGNTEVAYALDKELKDLTSVTTDKVTTKEIGLQDPTGKTTTIKNDGDRITYTKDGDTKVHEVATLEDEKHIKPGSYAVDNKGDVTMTYVDGKGQDVPNDKVVLTGIAKNDLSNITDDGKKVITGLGSKVEAGDNVTVTDTTDATTGQKTYTVNAKLANIADGKNTKKSGTGTDADPYKINVEGDLADINSITNGAGSGKLTFGPNETVTVGGTNPITLNAKTGNIGGLTNKTFDPNNIVSGQAATEDQLKSVHDTLKASELHIAPTAVKAGSTETKGGVVDGTENVYKYDAATKKVTLTYNDGNGNAVTDTKAVIDFSDLNIPTPAAAYSFKTNAAGNVDGNSTETEVASGKTVNFGAGKNLTVKQEIGGDGSHTYTYALNKDLTNLDKVVVNGKDGKDGTDGVTITGPSGTAGQDGNNGKVGISGKDGKDAVSISGKDGVGHIGLTGPAGKDGKNATADITVKDGVPGVDGQPGETMTRIVYQDKDGNEHQVATHDDGMKFAGDDGQTDSTKVIKKHLNNVVDIVGGADKAKLTDNNIGVNNDNGKLKVQLSKDLDLTENGSVKIGDTNINKDGLTIAGGPSVKKDGINAGDKKITGVKAGEDDTDAVNVKQLKDNATTVTSSDNSISVTDTNTDPAKGHAYDIKINNQGVVNNAQIPVVYTKEDGTKVYKQPNGTFTTNVDGTGDVVPANEVIASMNNAANSSTDPTKLQNVGSSIADKAGDTYLDKINNAAADPHAKTGAVNVSDLKETADAIGNKGLNFGTQSTGANSEIHKNLGEKLEIVGEGTKADDNYSASNIKTMTKDGKVVVALDKDLNGLNSIGVPGKDGVAGKDGVSISGKDGANGIDGKVSIGKDGKDAVSIAGKDGVGHIGLTGPQGPAGADGTGVDISTDHGSKTLVKPEANNGDKSERIVYVPKDKDGNPLKDTDGNPIKREVATMDDGLRFTGNNTGTENKHALNTLVKVQGEGVTAAQSTAFQSAAGNINVVADGNDTLTVKLNKDLKGINSIKNSDNGPALNFNAGDLSVTGGNLNMGGNKITNLGKGTNDTDAVNLKQLKDSRTIVKSTDGSVGVRESESADGAKVYDLSTGASPRFDELTDEIGRVGAQGAALAALKPIQYDPLEPTQIMAGYGNYRGNSAVALGVAHYKNESTLIHGGVSWAGGSSHMMANAGVTWKVGNRDSEAAVADRYRKGPISSAYAMQQEMASVKAQNAGLKTEVSDLKAENEQMKAQIAAMMAKLGM